MLSEVINSFLDIALPQACLICTKKIRNTPVCHQCLPSAKLNISRCYKCHTPNQMLDTQSYCNNCTIYPQIFKQIRYLWDYQDQAKAYISIMKYRPSQKLCHLAGEILAIHIDKLYNNCDWDLIVSPPPSKQALRQRGFSPTAIIIKKISKFTAIPYSVNALAHQGYKDFQASLDNFQRLNNVRNAFRANSAVVNNKSILLVDDVVTTGATSNELAFNLLKAGAISVDLLSLSRSDTWQTQRHNIHQQLAKKTLTDHDFI